MKRKRINREPNTVDMGYKMALYPNAEQRNLIARTLGCCRYVYNHALEERIRLYKENKQSTSYNKQCKKLPLMKQAEETKWLSEVDSTALQYTLRSLQDAFDNFFRGIREGQKIGYPKFKRKHDREVSYHSMNNHEDIASPKIW